MINELFSVPNTYNRNGHLDAVKGFAIFLMVIGHAITWLYEPGASSFRNHVWCNVIYGFHMYVLFFVSGYLFPKNNGLQVKEAGKVILKKIKTLLIPWLLGGMLNFIFRDSAITVLWFLISLFSFSVINAFWEVLRTKIKKECCFFDLIVYVAIMAMFFLVPKSARVFFHLFGPHYFLFCLGIIVRRFHFEFILENKISFSVASFIFLFFSSLPHWGINVPMNILFTATSGSLISWYFFKFAAQNGKTFCFLKSLGFYSLEIYVLHGFFSIRIPALGAYIDSLNDIVTKSTVELVFSGILSMVTLSLCMLVVKIFKDSFVYQLFLGKLK